ncbi:hypothetical protein BKA69DRAFT_687342 [Paraphysoderma sedebokerense]|nr:hypothetical protein BKA69DRAFT_687342 [Paraphysoderma sedebokerense]
MVSVVFFLNRNPSNSHDGSQPIRPALGFWQSNKTGTFLPCVPRDACPGYAENTCATGYEGTRCGQCSRNYYRFNNTCQKCEEDSMSLSLAVIGGFFGAGLLLYALFKYIIGSGSRLGLISILINFIQTILLLQQMRLNWPAEFHKILNLLSFLNFNIELTSPECIVSDQYLNFSLKMRLALLVPFLILAVAVVVPILDYTFQYFEFYLSRNIFKTPVFRPLLMFRVFNSGLSVAFVHITSNSLALFDCSFEDDGYSYLDRDTSLRCYEEWWVQDLPIATLATWYCHICLPISTCNYSQFNPSSVYVIGVPVYFATICYFAGKFGKDPGASRFCKFCHDLLAYESSYQERFQFFTVVQLLQKLFIVLISTFFTRYTGLQIILTLALLFVSFLVLREYSPYSYKRLNHLEALSHVCAMVVLALGLPFHLDQFRSFVYQHILMLLIIFVICSFIVFTMAVGVYDVIKYFRERASPKPEMYTPTKKTYIKREPRK